MVNTQDLQTGDILHCKGKTLLSKAIRWATKSKINHTALFISIWGEPYIIDAQDNGVNLKPFDEWVQKYGYEFVVHRSSKKLDEKKIAVKAMSKIGLTAYDFEGLIVKQPIELVTGKWKKKKGDKENDKMYCSEFVAWVYGLNDSYRTSPEDLLEYCKAEGFKEIYTTGIQI
jgi:hypothetical protein